MRSWWSRGLAVVVLCAGYAGVAPAEDLSVLEKMEQERIALVAKVASSLVTVRLGDRGLPGVLVTSDGTVVAPFHPGPGPREHGIKVILGDGNECEAEIVAVVAESAVMIARAKVSTSVTPATPAKSVPQVGAWAFGVERDREGNPRLCTGMVIGKRDEIRNLVSVDPFIEVEFSSVPAKPGTPVFNAKGEWMGLLLPGGARFDSPMFGNPITEGAAERALGWLKESVVNPGRDGGGRPGPARGERSAPVDPNGREREPRGNPPEDGRPGPGPKDPSGGNYPPPLGGTFDEVEKYWLMNQRENLFQNAPVQFPSQRNDVPEGAAMVLPASTITMILENIKANNGKFTPGYLGIEADHASSGVRVENVKPGSSAEQGGMKEGDLIVEVDGRKIRNHSQLRGQVMFRTNREVAVKVLRAGALQSLSLKIGAAESTGPEAAERPLELGLSVVTLTEEVAGYLGLQKVTGVVVSDVARGSLGEAAGFRKNDVIMKITRNSGPGDGNETVVVKDEAHFKELAAKFSGLVTFTVMAGDRLLPRVIDFARK